MGGPVEYSPRRPSPPRRRSSEPRGCSRPLVVLCRVMELLEQFRARYPFPLDDFQLEAIRAIEGGQSVIVSAPTGAGKTLVAEFAIHMALATGKRIAYTTPLKALSNQKFNDFTRAFGAETVGILTGDVKVNPHGRVLVMTTEILRNALYGSGLDDLGYIVLDECHYMGDEARGTVWEEIIVNAPTDVLLVGLSATVANVKEIADWISIVHRPIVPIFHPHRPVPLSYAVADLAGEIHEIAEVRAGRARLVGGEPRGPDDRGRWYTRRVVDPGVLIDGLETRGWLPAIYFIFSRAGCERATDDVLAEGKSLLTTAQQSGVDHAINELIHDSPTVAESQLNQTVFQALRLGVGLHHAGILPSLKRLIELLFERGLCRVVFATETMSLGIHMPARSVVLQGLTQRADHRFPALSHHELTQMAGRAGRRGIDPEGKCVIALDARDGVEDLLRVVDGSPEPIESQFKLGYGSAALLLATGAPPEALRRRIESSFGQYQNLKRIREMEGEIRSLEAALAEVKRYEAPCGDFQRIGRYRRARQEAEACRATGDATAAGCAISPPSSRGCPSRSSWNASGRRGPRPRSRRSSATGAPGAPSRGAIASGASSRRSRSGSASGGARSSNSGARTGRSYSTWSRCSSSSAPCATADSSREDGTSPASDTTTDCSQPRASSAVSSPTSMRPRRRRCARR